MKSEVCFKKLVCCPCSVWRPSTGPHAVEACCQSSAVPFTSIQSVISQVFDCAVFMLKQERGKKHAYSLGSRLIQKCVFILRYFVTAYAGDKMYEEQ